MAQTEQLGRRQRWNQATPALVLTLLFCCMTFIMFQLLVARTTLSRSSSASLLLAQSARLPQLAPDGTERPQRVLNCLRALDVELRSLVYQRIPSVETFATGLLRTIVAKHSELRACGCYDRQVEEKKLHRLARNIQQLRSDIHHCPSPVQPSLQQLDQFYANGSSQWQASWLVQPKPGGWHSPTSCRPDKSVLVLVPFRNRTSHLRTLLRQLHPILQAQNLCYTVVVGEQFGNATFNKAKLMNAVFLESLKLNWYDCIVFHDVDLIPTNPHIPYNCPAYPRHISVSIDKFGYALPYKQLVGGVLAMPVRQFLKVNGYSNLFWGWGGEDDDMETRIRSVGLLVTRPHPKLARYRMIRHGGRKEILDEVRYKLLYLSAKRYRLDGLNSLNYSVVSVKKRPLFTHIVVDIGKPPKSADFY